MTTSVNRDWQSKGRCNATTCPVTINPKLIFLDLLGVRGYMMGVSRAGVEEAKRRM